MSKIPSVWDRLIKAGSCPLNSVFHELVSESDISEIARYAGPYDRQPLVKMFQGVRLIARDEATREMQRLYSI